MRKKKERNTVAPSNVVRTKCTSGKHRRTVIEDCGEMKRKKKGNYRINNCSKLSRPQSVQEHVRMKWQAYLFGVVQATVYWMYRPESAQGKKRRIKERPLLWIQTDPPIQNHTL